MYILKNFATSLINYSLDEWEPLYLCYSNLNPLAGTQNYKKKLILINTFIQSLLFTRTKK